MTSREAAFVLQAYCVQETGKPPSSTGVGHKKQRPEACDEAWWTENRAYHMNPQSRRDRAYLSAYVTIAGAKSLPAGGIALSVRGGGNAPMILDRGKNTRPPIYEKHWKTRMIRHLPLPSLVFAIELPPRHPSI
jgi:hypothetical protein